MKKIVIVLIFLLSLIGLSSCENNKSLSIKSREEIEETIELEEVLTNVNDDKIVDKADVYEIITEELSVNYDTFISTCNESIGIGFSDYELSYENDYGYEYIACGFIPFDEGICNDEIVCRIDEDENNYINTYEITNYKSHFIKEDTYVSYEIENNNVSIEYDNNVYYNYKEGYGNLYNYDKNEYVYNLDIISFDDVKLASLTEIEDTENLVNLINETFKRQDKNFIKIEYKKMAPTIRDEVLSYINSQNEEFLGYDVNELK